MKWLSATEAAAIDAKLMSDEGAFTLQQLMELAGLSCAETVQKTYPPTSHPKVLVVAGPGNQGGDGLVAARHLWQFGYEPTLYYPKEGKNEFYQQLKKQAINCTVKVIGESDFEVALKETDVVLDAIFGFSFKGPVRAPFDKVISSLKDCKGSPPIVSVDIPSAWDVDEGNVCDSFEPEVLVSLTAPKRGSKAFKGRHFCGGRFVPADMAKELGLPAYPNASQIVEI